MLEDVFFYRFTRNDAFMYLGVVCGSCFASSLESLDDRNLLYVVAMVSTILTMSPSGDFPSFEIPLDFHFYQVPEECLNDDDLPF